MIHIFRYNGAKKKEQESPSQSMDYRGGIPELKFKSSAVTLIKSWDVSSTHLRKTMISI